MLALCLWKDDRARDVSTTMSHNLARHTVCLLQSMQLQLTALWHLSKQ